MISNIEHPFMCLLAVCISSLEKYLFSPSVCFLIGLFCGFFFDVEWYELFIYVEHQSLICHIICRYLLPLSRLMTIFSVMFGFLFLCVYLLQIFGLWLS